MRPGDLVAARATSTFRLRTAHADLGHHGAPSDGPFWAAEVEPGDVALVLEVVTPPRGVYADVRVLTRRGEGWIWADELAAV